MARVPLGRMQFAACAGALVTGAFLAGAIISGLGLIGGTFVQPAPETLDVHRAMVASLVEDATTAVGHTDPSRARTPSLVPWRAAPSSFDAIMPIAVLLLTLVALGLAASAGARAPGRCATRVAPSPAPPRVAVV